VNCANNSSQKDIENILLNGLKPATYESKKDVAYNLIKRMEYWNVPAVSFVVVDDMRISYAGAFGVKQIGDSLSVDNNTLFQAASISKPVTSVGIMTLYYQNKLDIDTDLNDFLKGFQISGNEYNKEITIRQILSHSAGLNVGGFSGYNSEENLPSLLQIIKGISPANSPKVQVVVEPGTKFMYSGGGYQILQKVVQDITGKKFKDVMREQVFEPLNMDRSYYAPLNSAQKQNTAYGHMIDQYIPDYAPIHVESAAGGLWTTPTDLGLLMIELMKAYNNEPSKILDSLTLHKMMKTYFWNFGLGFKLQGDGKSFRFSHGGATRGWHSHFMAFPERGEAVVVMTNGTNGWVLIPEIERSVSDFLDWPTLKPKLIVPIKPSEEQITEYEGLYDMNGLEIEIKSETDYIVFEGAGLKWNLIQTKKDTLEIMDMEGQVFFKRDKRNRVSGLHLWFGQPDWSPYRTWDFVKKD
jgi:CubicO group peptidase (beta-lactamase class C family)